MSLALHEAKKGGEDAEDGGHIPCEPSVVPPDHHQKRAINEHQDLLSGSRRTTRERGVIGYLLFTGWR